jgi:hypothetical protein
MRPIPVYFVSGALIRQAFRGLRYADCVKIACRGPGDASRAFESALSPHQRGKVMAGAGAGPFLEQ